MQRRLTEAEINEALDRCASEPVHIPGIVQPFGCLIGFEPESGIVRYVSENCDALIDRKAKALLGQNLRDALGSDVWHQLRNAASRSDFARRRTTLGSFDLVEGTPFELSAFKSGDYHVLEIEHSAKVDIGGSDALTSIGFLVSQAQSCTTAQELYDLSAELMRHVSGFDRVLVYKFDHDFNGEVVAEERRASIEPFLGLRFPSWDIPAQAREIMKKTPLRLIANVDQQSPRLLAAAPDLAPLDITLANCRGVSPVHMEFLKNMGSKATMTLNIVINDELWGMISFHHLVPKALPPRQRELLECFVPIFAAKLQSLRERQSLERIKLLDQAILANSKNDVRIEDILPAIGADAMEVIEADGIALLGNKRTDVFGVVPKPQMLREILAFSRTQDKDVAIVEKLSNQFPDLADHAAGCASVLVTPVSDALFMCLFRRDVSADVNWAGNPEKTVETLEGSSRLTPRGSFSAYLEKVEGFSKPWQDEEIYFAGHVRTLLHASERRAIMDRMSRQQTLMIAELNHRVRNILSLVKSVSSQARRRYGSLESYASAMENRIWALAASHELASDLLMQPVSTISLIQKELEPYGSIAETQVVIEGSDRNLRADIAPIFSLVIHELATNAAKYGALSIEAGIVSIKLEHSDGELKVSWEESGGPKVQQTNDPGFGTAMIEQAVPHELEGRAELEFAPDGVKASITVPSRHFDDESEPRPTEEPSALVVKETVAFPIEKISAPVLVLEDNFIIAKEMKDQLREFGVLDIEVFANVEDALAFIATDQVALAILDVNLGKSANSSPVAEALLDSGIPFIFVTGYGNTSQIGSRFDDVPLMTKPVSASELQSVIAEVFN